MVSQVIPVALFAHPLAHTGALRCYPAAFQLTPCPDADNSTCSARLTMKHLEDFDDTKPQAMREGRSRSGRLGRTIDIVSSIKLARYFKRSRPKRYSELLPTDCTPSWKLECSESKSVARDQKKFSTVTKALHAMITPHVPCTSSRIQCTLPQASVPVAREPKKTMSPYQFFAQAFE